jgi:hypothetical protein
MQFPRPAVQSWCIATALGLSLIATPAAPQTCEPYKPSGPVVVSRDGEVVQNLVITARTGPGITVNGFRDVTINNVVILHANGPGIAVSDANNATITNADIVYTGGPRSGPNPSTENNNIDCYSSASMTVQNVRLTRGSSGIFMDHCPGSNLSFIEGHDQRGPFPRGQLVQWAFSDNGTLTDFSNEASQTRSFTEDNVNIYHTEFITIRRGLVDGNNAPSGDGVIVDEHSGNVLVSDVDAVHQGNACFGIWGKGTHDVTYRNTRCRDTYCASPRGVPSSDGLGWGIDPRSVAGNLKIVSSVFANLCNPTNIVWNTRMLAVNDIRHQNFTPRPPLRVKLCQYGE